jgi:5-methylcytosine-specific restriction endonuclease McrA
MGEFTEKQAEALCQALSVFSENAKEIVEEDGYRERYEKYLKSPEWQKKRSERLKIDNYKCQRCGYSYCLQVHHLNYDTLGHEDVYKDLITLCRPCHEEIEKAKGDNESKRALIGKEIETDRFIEKEKLAYEFIKRFYKEDFVFGGNKNMCMYANIFAYMKEYYPLYDGMMKSRVVDFFSAYHKKKVLELRDKGVSKNKICSITRLKYGRVDIYLHDIDKTRRDIQDTLEWVEAIKKL